MAGKVLIYLSNTNSAEIKKLVPLVRCLFLLCLFLWRLLADTPIKCASSLFNPGFILSMLVATALLYYHWEAMLVSYLSTRKAIIPFKTLTDMYLNTDFRLALIPDTSYKDDFKFSTNPIWQKIFKQRLQPHLQEYSDYPNHLFDMIYFIKNDFETALYESYAPIRYLHTYISISHGHNYYFFELAIQKLFKNLL